MHERRVASWPTTLDQATDNLKAAFKPEAVHASRSPAYIKKALTLIKMWFIKNKYDRVHGTYVIKYNFVLETF